MIAHRGRTLDPARPVCVHRNRGNTPARWAIRQDRRIVAYAEEVVLRDVRFVVRPRGLERLRREPARLIVCAYAAGWLTDKAPRVVGALIRFDVAAGAFVDAVGPLSGAFFVEFGTKALASGTVRC